MLRNKACYINLPQGTKCLQMDEVTHIPTKVTATFTDTLRHKISQGGIKCDSYTRAACCPSYLPDEAASVPLRHLSRLYSRIVFTFSLLGLNIVPRIHFFKHPQTTSFDYKRATPSFTSV